MGMEGGMGGVQLLVPGDRIEAALKVLKEFETQDKHPKWIERASGAGDLGQRLHHVPLVRDLAQSVVLTRAARWQTLPSTPSGRDGVQRPKGRVIAR
jgi:hypothetical protein